MSKSRSYRIFLSIIVISTLFSSISFAQYESNENYTPPLKERILYGGNFSLQFGNYTYIDISPVVGLWLLPRVAVAAGPSYKYIRDPLGSTNVYGGKAYSRFFFIQDLNKIIPLGYRISLYAHIEYERMSYRSAFFYTTYESERISQDNVLAGLGVSQWIGMRSSLNISVLWLVNESEIQIYDSPEIRIGFTF